MKTRGIFAILAPMLALLSHGQKAIGYTPSRPRKGKRGSGSGNHKNFGTVPGSKLWHRLTVGHSNCAALANCRLRRYCARGYGYIEPENAKATA